MSNYIEVKNDNSNVIINDNFKNITLTNKVIINEQGSGTANDTYKFCSNGHAGVSDSTGHADYPKWYYVLVPIRENVISFVSCSEPTVLVHMNDIFTYENRFSAKRIEFFLPTGKTINDLLGKVTIYEFSYSSSLSSGPCGVQIFNASNEKIFDTNYKYLNIIKSISNPDIIDGTPFGADDIAIHFGSYSCRYVSPGSYVVSAMIYHALRFNANKTLSAIPVSVGITQSFNNVWGTGYDYPDYQFFYSPLLIADVTNY